MVQFGMTYDDLLDELAARRAELLEAAKNVPEAQATAKRSPDSWSIVEVLEHVTLVEELIAGLLGQLVDRAERRGRLTSPAPTEMALRIGLLESLPRYDVIPAFPGSEPTGEINLSAAVEELKTSRGNLLVATAAGSQFDCSTLIAPHFIGRLNFYEWIMFAAVHDRLHLVQLTS